MALKRRFILSASALGVLATPGIRRAGAQTWPSRPIEWIVPFGAGGGADVLARTLAPFLERHLGEGARIGVVNRGGAGGEIGFTAIATARPDGYTIGSIHAPAFLTIPHERRARFDFDSFEYIGNVETDAMSVFVRADSPHRTLAEFVDFAKANPRRPTCGLSGLGTATHLGTIAFMQAAGVELTLVPFPSSGQSRTALLGGHITAATFGIGDGAPLVREGQLRMLGTMSASRWGGLPDGLTMREQGVDAIAGTDRGLGAPAGTPPEVLSRLSDALGQVLRDPGFLSQANARGIILNPMSSADWRAYLAQQNEAIANLWRTNPWRQ